MNSKFTTLFWISQITIIGLTTGMVLSQKLWFSQSLFPAFPVIDNLPILSVELQFQIALFFIILLGASLIIKKQSWITQIIIFLSILLVIYDQNRLQPWFYQYIITLIFLGVFNSLSAYKLFFSSIYIWSGLQKINMVFMASIFPWMIEPITNYLPASLHPYVFTIGIVAPFIEVLIGIGLLTQRFKKIAGIIGIGMHVGILAVLGPWGHNWNSIVWPWNIVMIATIILLMYDPNPISFTDVTSRTKKIILGIALTITGIFPVFNFIGYWDSYLSSSLYSGTVSTATMTIANEPYDYVQTSLDTLNVPPYPEPRIYRKIFKHVCTMNTSVPVTMTITHRKNIFTSQPRSEHHSCNVP